MEPTTKAWHSGQKASPAVIKSFWWEALLGQSGKTRRGENNKRKSNRKINSKKTRDKKFPLTVEVHRYPTDSIPVISGNEVRGEEE